MNNKGYFFILDAFIASVIIIVSLVAILNSDVAVSPRSKDFSQAESVSNFILNTKMEDLNDPWVNDWISDNHIFIKPRKTILQQIDFFYYNIQYVCESGAGGDICRGVHDNLAKTLLGNVTEKLISEKYGYRYRIIEIDPPNTFTILNRSEETMANSSFRIFTKKISYSYINQTAFFKPHIVEFAIWIK